MSIGIRDQFHQVLNHLLIQGDEADRCYAARAAGQAGIQSSRQALLNCLYHEDTDVCVDAADALGKLPPDDSTDDLVSHLITVVEQHPEGDAKAAAANALAKLDQPAALEAMLSWAKGNPTTNDFVEEWDDWWDIQLDAIQALGRIGHEDAVPLLLTVLEEEPLDIEADILRALSRCGEPGIRAVIELSRSSQPRLVRRSMNALGQCTCDASLIAVFKGLHHDQPDVRSHAAQALGQRQAITYFIDLLYLLKDQDADVRQQALNAARTMLPQLQPFHSKYLTLDKFTALYRQLDAKGRSLILNALDQLLSQDQLQKAPPAQQDALAGAIRESLNSGDGEETEAAVQLLPKVHISNAQQLLLERIEETGLPLSTRRYLISALVHLPDDPQNCLLPLNNLLHNETAAMRQVVMETLVQLAQKPTAKTAFSCTDLLALYLAGEDICSDKLQQQLTPAERPTGCDDNQMIPSVMVNADGEPDSPPQPLSDEERMAQILDQFGDTYPVANTAGADTANTHKPQPRSTLDAINLANIEAALQTESQTEDTGRGEHIREMVDTLPEEMHSFGDIVIGHLDTGSKLSLNRKKIAKLPDYNNQLLAVRALGKLISNDSVDQLLKGLLSDDPLYVLEVISSLALIAEQDNRLSSLENTVGPLSTLLLAGTDQIRHMSARALGALGSRKPMPVLKQALLDEDSNVRMESIRALQKILPNGSPDSVIAVIRACLQDPVDGVVLTACDYLLAEQAVKPLATDTSLIAHLTEQGLSNSALTAKTAETLAALAPEQAARLLLAPILNDDFAPRRPRALQMLSYLI